MVKKVDIEYAFYPVGQGLFAAGSCAVSRGRKFRWVYDCGTSDESVKIDDIIKGYVSSGIGSSYIDLLAISHFDKDHISGVISLLRHCSVGMLLLPYATLAQRLVVAFAMGIDPDDSMMEFFINPVRYLVERGSVARFVFVPSGGQAANDGEASNARLYDENSSIRIEAEDPLSEDAQADYAAFRKYGEVAWLRTGGRIFHNAWEFVPYNDASLLSRVPNRFAKTVAVLSKQLLDNKSDVDLQSLKSLYANCFSGSRKVKNQISLFLYGGIVGYGSLENARFCTLLNKKMEERIVLFEYRLGDAKSSVLYTGDGYLNAKKKMDALVHYLGQMRIGRIFCFQVMHHGSKYNWHKGLAEQLAPSVSVFSSDHSGSYKHPHAEVLRDFYAYNPVLVSSDCKFEAKLKVISCV